MVGKEVRRIKSVEKRRIQVFVRLRPHLPHVSEEDSAETGASPNEPAVRVLGTNVVQCYGDPPREFDGVLGPSSTQAEVFAAVGAPALGDVFLGYHCTVFLYGQTGSGKTYTAQGMGNGGGAGMIPRCVGAVFDNILTDEEHEYRVEVQWVQIYQDTVLDLLDPKGAANLPIRECPDTGIYVQGARSLPVSCPGDFSALFKKAEAERVTGATAMNAASSRSHSILILDIHRRRLMNPHEYETKRGVEGFTRRVARGKLYIVDLAGSERLKKTLSEGVRLEEAKAINTSLSALGNVLQALVDGAEHIPYRESKLTRLLQHSLGGGGVTSFVVTVSPTWRSLSETRNSLLFAERAKEVKNSPVVHVEVDAAARFAALEAALEDKISGLEQRCRELEAALAAERQNHPTTSESKREEGWKEEVRRAKAAAKEGAREFTEERERWSQLEADLRAEIEERERALVEEREAGVQLTADLALVRRSEGVFRAVADGGEQELAVERERGSQLEADLSAVQHREVELKRRLAEAEALGNTLSTIRRETGQRVGEVEDVASRLTEEVARLRLALAEAESTSRRWEGEAVRLGSELEEQRGSLLSRLEVADSERREHSDELHSLSIHLSHNLRLSSHAALSSLFQLETLTREVLTQSFFLVAQGLQLKLFRQRECSSLFHAEAHARNALTQGLHPVHQVLTLSLECAVRQYLQQSFETDVTLLHSLLHSETLGRKSVVQESELSLKDITAHLLRLRGLEQESTYRALFHELRQQAVPLATSLSKLQHEAAGIHSLLRLRCEEVDTLQQRLAEAEAGRRAAEKNAVAAVAAEAQRADAAEKRQAKAEAQAVKAEAETSEIAETMRSETAVAVAAEARRVDAAERRQAEVQAQAAEAVAKIRSEAEAAVASEVQRADVARAEASEAAEKMRLEAAIALAAEARCADAERRQEEAEVQRAAALDDTRARVARAEAEMEVAQRELQQSVEASARAARRAEEAEAECGASLDRVRQAEEQRKAAEAQASEAEHLRSEAVAEARRTEALLEVACEDKVATARAAAERCAVESRRAELAERRQEEAEVACEQKVAAVRAEAQERCAAAARDATQRVSAVNDACGDTLAESESRLSAALQRIEVVEAQCAAARRCAEVAEEEAMNVAQRSEAVEEDAARRVAAAEEAAASASAKVMAVEAEIARVQLLANQFHQRAEREAANALDAELKRDGALAAQNEVESRVRLLSGEMHLLTADISRERRHSEATKAQVNDEARQLVQDIQGACSRDVEATEEARDEAEGRYRAALAKAARLEGTVEAITQRAEEADEGRARAETECKTLFARLGVEIKSARRKATHALQLEMAELKMRGVIESAAEKRLWEMRQVGWREALGRKAVRAEWLQGISDFGALRMRALGTVVLEGDAAGMQRVEALCREVEEFKEGVAEAELRAATRGERAAAAAAELLEKIRTAEGRIRALKSRVEEGEHRERLLLQSLSDSQEMTCSTGVSAARGQKDLLWTQTQGVWSAEMHRRRRCLSESVLTEAVRKAEQHALVQIISASDVVRANVRETERSTRPLFAALLTAGRIVLCERSGHRRAILSTEGQCRYAVNVTESATFSIEIPPHHRGCAHGVAATHRPGSTVPAAWHLLGPVRDNGVPGDSSPVLSPNKRV